MVMTPKTAEVAQGVQPANLVCGIVLLRADGAALLQLRDDKPTIQDPGIWVVPGGHAEPYETAEDAARREFKEETCYDCADMRLLVSLSSVEVGYSGNFQLAFFWSIFDGEQKIVCREGQALSFVRRDEIEQLPRRDYLTRIWDLALIAREAELEGSARVGFVGRSIDFVRSRGSGEIVRWLAAGLLFLVLNTLFLKIFIGIFGIRAVLGTLLAGELSTLLRYFVNDRWVFGRRRPKFSRLLQYHVANGAALAIWWLATNIIISMGVNYLVAGILSVGLSTGFSMASNFFWIWRKAQPTAAGSN
jgi:8-oxo-dGTP pyrophosphatase MutT (NUDIX family)/putative flippase GtrA